MRSPTEETDEKRGTHGAPQYETPKNETPKEVDDLASTEYYDKTEIQGDVCTRMDEMSLVLPFGRTWQDDPDAKVIPPKGETWANRAEMKHSLPTEGTGMTTLGNPTLPTQSANTKAPSTEPNQAQVIAPQHSRRRPKHRQPCQTSHKRHEH